MARGKHAARKHNRDSKQLARLLDEARAELAAEQDRLRQAEADAAEVDALEQQLGRARRERDHAVAGEVTRLTRELEVMTTLLRESQVFDEQIHQEWARVSDAVVTRLGGGLDGYEQFMQIAFTGGYIRAGSPGLDHLGSLGVQRVQKMQGIRRSITATSDKKATARYLDACLRRRHYRTLHELLDADGDLASTANEQDRKLLTELDRRLDRLDRAGPADVHPDTVHAWHPMLWLQTVPIGGHRATELLGATHPPDPRIRTEPLPNPVPEPTPEMTAARRSMLASSDPEQLLQAWQQPLHRSAAVTAASGRIPHPFAEPPRYPRPGDAVSIKHWYSMAALGHWSRLHDTVTDQHPDPDVDADRMAVARAELPDAAALAVGLAAATPFWLPSGQTAAYVDSEPLPEADSAEVRLPFPQVLLVLAEPLQLPPLPGFTIDADLDHVLHELDNAVLARHREKQDTTFGQTVMKVVDTKIWDTVPELGAAISARGALVEAVLLLGDSLGRPEDLFGWCLAVPAATGGVLGRWIVPARRSHTEFAHQIMNLAAVAAWADWHSPDRELDIPAGLSNKQLNQLLVSSDFKRLEQRGGAGAVRVLNVKRTTGESAASNDAQPRTVAPHVRRGHWRRQHHGPQRQLVKRVRIAPVLVNAGRSDIAPRVYRLPTPETGDGEGT